MARQRKLSPERKAFINSLIEHYQPEDAQDVQEMLKDLLGDTLQGMLEAEMDAKLGYSKYNYKDKDTDDSRNGYSKKTVVSSMGEIDLDIMLKGLWHTLPILIGLFAACLLVFYGTAWIAGLLAALRDRLLGQ